MLVLVGFLSERRKFMESITRIRLDGPLEKSNWDKAIAKDFGQSSYGVMVHLSCRGSFIITRLRWGFDAEFVAILVTGYMSKPENLQAHLESIFEEDGETIMTLILLLTCSQTFLNGEQVLWAGLTGWHISVYDTRGLNSPVLHPLCINVDVIDLLITET